MKIKDRAKPKQPPVEPGIYMAVCIGIIDLGEQHSEKFKNYSNKVKFVWALPGETVTIDGKEEERQLSKEFTMTVSKKGALRGFLESWNGRSYSDEEFGELDTFDQLGKACQLQVVLNDTKEYSIVANLMPIPRGIPAPQSRTAMYTWDMEKWDDGLFEKLPEWTREQIMKSTQYQKAHVSVTDVAVQGAQAGQAIYGGAVPPPAPLTQGSQVERIATALTATRNDGVVMGFAGGATPSVSAGGTASSLIEGAKGMGGGAPF